MLRALAVSVNRPYTRAVLVLLLLQVAGMAVTLEQLNLNELIDASTFIVRGQVVASSCVKPGGLAYTQYELKVVEVLQGKPEGSKLKLALPGCLEAGRSQVFSGVPTPLRGVEYVFFLWRGRSGLLQLAGMTQGLLKVQGKQASAFAARAPIDGVMVNRQSGLPVRDSGVRISLARLRARVAAASPRSGVAR